MGMEPSQPSSTRLAQELLQFEIGDRLQSLRGDLDVEVTQISREHLMVKVINVRVQEFYLGLSTGQEIAFRRSPAGQAQYAWESTSNFPGPMEKDVKLHLGLSEPAEQRGREPQDLTKILFVKTVD